jgi:hypothetical protein
MDEQTIFILAKTRKNLRGRWRNLVESKNKVEYELNQSLYEALKENLRDKDKPESSEVPFVEEELEQVDKDRLLKKWKESAGYFGLNPDKFKFSLKNL